MCRKGHLTLTFLIERKNALIQLFHYSITQKEVKIKVNFPEEQNYKDPYAVRTSNLETTSYLLVPY